MPDRILIGAIIILSTVTVASPAAFAQGPPLTCDGIMGVGPNKIGGKNLVGSPCDKDEQLGPQPEAKGNCNCMVYLDTTNRRIVDSAQKSLLLECNGHYGHGACPTGPKCDDSPHSAPYGNWGVRFTRATATGAAGLRTRNLSGLDDCMQWRGTRRDTGCGAVKKFTCFQWHGCTCDDNLDPAHFNPKKPQDAPPPQFLSAPSARAGWYRIDTNLPQCSSLSNVTLNVAADFEVFELDGTGGSDLVARMSAQSRVPLTCRGSFLCEGTSERFTVASGPIAADARFIVMCRSTIPRPPPGGGGGGSEPPPPGNKRCGERCNGATECASGFCDASNHCTRKFAEEACVEAE